MKLEQYQKRYLEELAKVKEPAIRTFVDRAEAVLPKTYRPLYEKIYRDLGIIIMNGTFLGDPFLVAAKETLSAKGISVSLWVKYIVLSGILIPLYAAQKSKNKTVENSVRGVIKVIEDVVSVAERGAIKEEVLTEGILRSIFTRIKNIFVKAIKKLSIAVVSVLSAIISIYNDIFALITAPTRKIVNAIPGGKYIVNGALSVFQGLTLTPTVSAIIRIHNVLTNPTIVQSSVLVKKVVTGEVWKELDKMFDDISRDIDWSEVDKFFEQYEKEELATSSKPSTTSNEEEVGVEKELGSLT